MAYIHAFSYLSAKVWDDFVSAYNYTNCIDISELIFFLNTEKDQNQIRPTETRCNRY